MNNNFLEQLIEESQLGYAYHKIICDENGIPCNYEFIETNTIFEKYIGLKSLDIVGRKVTEVLPDIKSDKVDWIRICGDIAINGGKKDVNWFSEALKRWYKVNIYSPKKYHFITYISDISYEMIQIAEMKKLVEISEEFLQINDQKTDYKKIVNDFSKMTGAKYVVFNIFDEEGKTFSTISISGKNQILNKVSAIMGFEIESKKWKFGQKYADRIKTSTITRFNSLGELARDFMPAPLIVLLEKTFNTGECIVIKILRKNIMIGTFNLFMAKGEKFTKDTLAELYIKQLGMFITRKRAEDALADEKILTDAIFHSAPGLIYLYDDQSRLVRWNKKHEGITGYSSSELSKMHIKDWSAGDEESMVVVREGLNRSINEGFGEGEAKLKKKDGTIIPMHFTASFLYLNGKQYFAGIAIDITERKKKEKEIYYLNYHDQLTGLYNRRFYEEELKRLDIKKNLPISIVMSDELLKKVAEVIQLGCRADDIIARLGGDEFVILLPSTDAVETDLIIKHITELALCEKVGSINISISFGFETKYNAQEDIQSIFKNAEDHMYRRKLFEGPSIRGKIIKAIINTLYEKNKREEQHSHRVSALCRRMADALGLPEYEIEELKSVGLLHDIGKIAIDENILNKPGKLNDYEWNEIKRHPEIGYRILSTLEGMSQMAEYILAHHERWDGKGYPKGLKGQEIPFVSRIITIADAYDAMISYRSYQKTLTKEDAILQLLNNAGFQFDSKLVEVFIEKVLGETE